MIRKGIHKSAVVDVEGDAEIPPSTILEPLVAIYIGREGKLHLGRMNIFYPHCSVRIDQGWMTTGEEVSFGPGCHIYEPRGGLSIGNHCMFAGGVAVCGVNHQFSDRSIPMRHQPAVNAPVVIEDDVWVGMNATILPGVTIGKGAVIGAGSVVTKDIPEYSVATGIPCTTDYKR